MMNSITMENFRCFRERQTVRLAPLTLLVGENSTGKTSFLALVRALGEAGYGEIDPNFKDQPYDLGSFQNIVYVPNEDDEAGFEIGFSDDFSDNENLDRTTFTFKFAERSSAPRLVERECATRGVKVRDTYVGDGDAVEFDVETEGRSWGGRFEAKGLGAAGLRLSWNFLTTALNELAIADESSRNVDFDPSGKGGQLPISRMDADALLGFLEDLRGAHRYPPFASAPVRSRPKRTYDPTRPAPDPEGDYVPMYLADVSIRDEEVWRILKDGLEKLGKRSGLFSEIDIRKFGGAGDPFHVQVRNTANGVAEPWRNLIDVGYGVGQALPVFTELLRPSFHKQFLLQQPEVHLHPMAQAALGTLFCEFVGSQVRSRQIIVETHSDHLINRVRMDVRDGVTELAPQDVIVLYFERKGPEVKIHEVTFDELGNLDGAPPSYGRFFMEEADRSVLPDEHLMGV